MPQRGTTQSAGIDIFIPNEGSFYVKAKDGDLISVKEHIKLRPGMSVLIPAGIKANVPDGHALIAFNKSGVAAKKDLVIGACVIDEDYQGEIHIDIKNVGDSDQILSAGDKITQLVCLPVNYVSIEEAEDEDDCFAGVATERGTGGFGSTGTK
jgi:dUTP pyrophosphatase